MTSDANHIQSLRKTEEAISRNFISRYFQHQSELIKEKASNNVRQFSELLFSRNTKQPLISDDVIASNLTSPDFNKTLERAIEISALSDETQKMEVLADLILVRLNSPNQSTQSFIIKTAVELLGQISSHHLKLLTYIFRIHSIRRALFTRQITLNTENNLDNVLTTFESFLEFTFDENDFKYLESINCVKIDDYIELREFYIPKWITGSIYDLRGNQREHLLKLIDHWQEKSLKQVVLTVVGTQIATISSNYFPGS